MAYLSAFNGFGVTPVPITVVKKIGKVLPPPFYSMENVRKVTWRYIGGKGIPAPLNRWEPPQWLVNEAFGIRRVIPVPTIPTEPPRPAY